MVDHAYKRRALAADAFRRYAPELRRFAARLGEAPADADDVVSDAFTRVLTLGEERFLAISNLRAYLFRVTQTSIVERRKQEARLPSISADEWPAAPGEVGDILVRDAQMRWALAALRRLAPTQQRVLILQAAGHSRADIARALRMSTTNVSTVLHRARTALRTHYARELIESSPPACGTDGLLLARVALGLASARDREHFAVSGAICAECVRAVDAARQELGLPKRIRSGRDPCRAARRRTSRPRPACGCGKPAAPPCAPTAARSRAGSGRSG
ncbi:RNA polymerase sigma factor (sigma-70 family) [Microbacterium sp. SORGH_AS 862]|nr:RNA polymerase sigma factor (sigma-70 family) [Microbacterium sp. SORGH_AS_0862]